MKKMSMALDDLLKRRRGKQDAAPVYPDRIGGGNRLIRLVERPVFIAILALVYFSIPFVVHWRHLLAGELFVSGDGMTNVNYMLYVGESIKNGDFPLWTPYLAGGMPFAEDVALDIMYPPLWLCSLLPRTVQLCVYFGLHYALGGVAMFAYLKRIKCSPFVSFAVSTMYLFTIHMGGARKEHVSLIVAALYVPVILYFLERYLQERKLRWLLCGSAAMAMQFYGGFLQYVVYTDIFAFFYLLCSGIRRRFSLKTMLYHGTLWVAAYFGMAMACVLPMAQMLGRLSSSGGADMSYEGFVVGSLHPVKLLMTILPYYFGDNVWMALVNTGNYTSEMDIELLLGTSALAAVLAGIGLIKRNFHARFMVIGAGVILTFACIGQFPFLAKILYKIPLISMFRLPSRCLFLFTFTCMVILALSFNELADAKEHDRRFSAANLFILGVFCVVAVMYPFVEINGVEKLGMRKVFLVPGICFLIYLILFYIGRGCVSCGKIRRTVFSGIMLAIVLVTSLYQFMPFYHYSYYTSYNAMESLPTELVSDLDDNYKVFSSGRQTGKLVANDALPLNIMGLNSYTNFNIPQMQKYIYHTDITPMNMSGLYIFDQSTVEKTLRENNNFISMMGVKYVLSAPDQTDRLYSLDYTTKSVLLDENFVELVPGQGFSIAVFPIHLESDSYYQIFLTVEAPQDSEVFYVDIIGKEYDQPEQETHFLTRQGERTYTTILPTADVDEIEDTYFRIVSFAEPDIQISDVRVEKITPQKSDDYALVIEEDSFDVYENRNAKPLVYAPERVEPISEEEKTDLYLYTDKYDILNTAYITGGTQAYDFTGADVQISDIELKNNQVSAKVEAGSDAFVNMSQTYYPGWRAYVDGERTELWEVNGIIQGAFVPAGEHTVEFVYRPAAFFAGLFISIATAAVCCAVGLLDRRKPWGGSAVKEGGDEGEKRKK